MYSLLENSLQSFDKEDDKYTIKFKKLYPSLYQGQEPYFYSGKCSVMSHMFIKMLYEKFNVKEKKELLVVFKQDWDKRNENHTVVKLGNIIYDTSIRQMEGFNQYTRVCSFSIFMKDYEFNSKIIKKISYKDSVFYIDSWIKFMENFKATEDQINSFEKIKREQNLPYENIDDFASSHLKEIKEALKEG